MLTRMLVTLMTVCAVMPALADEGSPDATPMPTIIDGDTVTPPDSPSAVANPAETTEPTATTPSPEDVMRQMLEERQDAPIIEPTVRPGDTDNRRNKAPTASVNVDTSILGIAPGGKQPTLRREGEFIVARAGRLVRAPDGANMLFVFDADGQASPEAPLILLPCQMLQSMEDIVQQRGDRVVFILSGQITAYRGANYVMPTMMKLAIDSGNIE